MAAYLRAHGAFFAIVAVLVAIATWSVSQTPEHARGGRRGTHLHSASK